MPTSTEDRVSALEAETAELRLAVVSLAHAAARHKPIPLRRTEHAALGAVVARVFDDRERGVPDRALSAMLKATRLASGEPPETVAHRAGIDVSELLRIENAEVGATWEAACRFASALGAGLSEPFVRPVSTQITGKVE